MASSRCFVQLSHPHWEHEPDSGPEKAWHKQEHCHRRKFLLLHGQWIEENGDRRVGDLHAWGEWEAESELVTTLDRTNGDSPRPRWLWRPYYLPKDSYEGLHNTDPFIFGPWFLYSNCRRFAARPLGRLRRQPARAPAHPVCGCRATAAGTPPCSARSRARRRSPATGVRGRPRCRTPR